jgi:hypothetical protein
MHRVAPAGTCGCRVVQTKAESSPAKALHPRLQADATVGLLGARDGWVPTHHLTALLLLAVPGSLHSKIGLMFRLLDR